MKFIQRILYSQFRIYPVLLALLIPAAAQSNSPKFKSVNLIQKENSHFEKIPIYDQGDAGVCYSFTAATVLDYYRISHGEKINSTDELTSTLWLSVAYKNSLFSGINRHGGSLGDFAHFPLDSGDASKSIKALIKTGHCTNAEAKNAMTPLTSKNAR